MAFQNSASGSALKTATLLLSATAIPAHSKYFGIIDLTVVPCNETNDSLDWRRVTASLDPVQGLLLSVVDEAELVEDTPRDTIVQRLRVTVENTTDSPLSLTDKKVLLTGEAAASRPPDATRNALPTVTWAASIFTVTDADGASINSLWTDISPESGVTDHGELDGLADDDHPQYQLRTEKNTANGYAGLDAGAKLASAQLPSHTHTLAQVTDAGSAASKNVPSSGNAASGEVVMGSDTRLTDARTPTTHTHTLSQITDAGTAASKSVPASGNAASGEVVLGSDTRLSDVRTPTAHTHTLADITDAGNAASKNVGTTAGTVAAGDDSRLLAAYEFHGSVQGKPLASVELFRMKATRAFTLPASLTGSKSSAGTSATASTTFDIKKNGVSVGSFNYAAAATTATFTMASLTSFAVDDILTVVAPATPDATLANMGFTLVGTLV